MCVKNLTQKERDNETGLDYFLARYYSSVQGRFTSPDEFTGGPDELFDFVEDAASNPIFYAELEDPQSLNKYQYSYNNPLRYTDPDGRQGQGEKSLTQRLKEGAREAAKTVVRTVNGAASALAEDNGLGSMDAEQNSAGRAIGHGLALVQSGAEIVGGAAIAVGGGAEAIVTSPAVVTVVGAAAPAVGVAATVGGVVTAAHGVLVGANTVNNIFNKNNSSDSSGTGGQGNPFKGKTPQQIDDGFRKKGFSPRGPDPTAGKGGYVNPKTGRSYHIDPGGKYKKGVEKPHVDVNRPKGSKLPKKKFEL